MHRIDARAPLVVKSAVRGTITEIQRFSIHDGPGIRTTLFFKGCPLHCLWCHNPETMRALPEILFYPERCIVCGRCVEICPEHNERTPGGISHRHAVCDACVSAALECPTGALRLSGERRETAELVRELVGDRVFFEEAGGGVTISGGEPLAQPEFAAELLASLQAEGIHTCVDTSLHGDYAHVKHLAEHTDLFLVDCKETDPSRHEVLTGARPDLILSNLERLSADGAPIWLRCPIVPGINDRNDHLDAVGELAERLPAIAEVWILPFHPTAAHKWSALGRDYAFEDVSAPNASEIVGWAERIASRTRKPVRYTDATARPTGRSAR